ncbi:hypothetical protein K458DRAFT_420752 [Lentithecium fluviatile CBS 122367]|uniref:Uncharacterized protein n=1 Tax=Lentithecium fluviatile CBS 122367 TaxID=1168545 RepID=A0A6G1ISL2_9PLEO|nr:hypothetical protein K458DRAFT_420752 [Lentithecium fluviatile CBS 122367]
MGCLFGPARNGLVQVRRGSWLSASCAPWGFEAWIAMIVAFLLERVPFPVRTAEHWAQA